MHDGLRSMALDHLLEMREIGDVARFIRRVLRQRKQGLRGEVGQHQPSVMRRERACEPPRQISRAAGDETTGLVRR